LKALFRSEKIAEGIQRRNSMLKAPFRELTADAESILQITRMGLLKASFRMIR